MSRRASSAQRPGAARLPLLERCLAAPLTLLLRAHAATLRFREDGAEPIRALHAAGRPLLLVTWHGRLLVLFYRLWRFVHLVMISRSRDGERVAALSSWLGIATVRGSSSRAGAAALLELVRLLGPGRVAALMVDGPRGPAGAIKPGLILAAQRSGAAIVPVYVTAARRWEARSWDRMQVPWPWSRVLVRWDAPVEVPPDLDAEGAEKLRLDLERRMKSEYARLEAELEPRGGAGSEA